MTTRVRKRFSCAHFYRQPRWSDSKNKSEFGKCFDPYGHGHDYLLEIEFQSSQPDLALRVLEEIVEHLDHHHLNYLEFQNQVPTTENLAVYIQSQLLNLCLKNQILIEIQNLTLFENSEIWVEIFQKSP
jgi:6-pyruvoyltetrahydropterin/6-carboxytetrahydropterin synthase